MYSKSGVVQTAVSPATWQMWVRVPPPLPIPTVSRMKAKRYIQINAKTYETLFSLECVTAVQRDPRGHIIVCLSPSATRGSLRARTGDWLVQFASGEWQRFGSEAYQRLVANPATKPWESD